MPKIGTNRVSTNSKLYHEYIRKNLILNNLLYQKDKLIKNYGQEVSDLIMLVKKLNEIKPVGQLFHPEY
jgi:hypothetical protein